MTIRFGRLQTVGFIGDLCIAGPDGHIQRAPGDPQLGKEAQSALQTALLRRDEKVQEIPDGLQLRLEHPSPAANLVLPAHVRRLARFLPASVLNTLTHPVLGPVLAGPQLALSVYRTGGAEMRIMMPTQVFSAADLSVQANKVIDDILRTIQENVDGWLRYSSPSKFAEARPSLPKDVALSLANAWACAIAFYKPDSSPYN